MAAAVAETGHSLTGEKASPVARSKRAWILAIAFAVSLGATGFFATRFVVHAIYWSQHRDEPIAPWMTVGYVARSYDIAPLVLQEALGLVPGVRDRRTLGEIAASQGREFDAVRSALERAIAATRSSFLTVSPHSVQS